MSNKLLTRYANLIVCHGLNIQPDQVLNINAEFCHRDFALLVAEAAYKRGAKFVAVDLQDPRVARTRILHSKPENLSYVPRYFSIKYQDLVDDQSSNLRIAGSDYPDILADLDPQKINTVRLNQRLAMNYFYDEGINKSKVHWTVAAAATTTWAEKVFPELKGEQAREALWQVLFKICRVEDENVLELWKKHDDQLKRRAKILSELKISEIRFTGPGTDLTIGLSPKALFVGGSDRSPRGVDFEPNIPTEEVYTTPDWRKTTGTVQTTRPFYINGRLIKDLFLVFKEGAIVDFKATEGADTFREYISSDPGACHLGEVALVGIDSPIYKSGLVFQEILLDENAACHIAVGSAYKNCLDHGSEMSKEELDAVGCNESTVHTDMMISSAEVNVTAKTAAGTKELIHQGEWIIS